MQKPSSFHSSYWALWSYMVCFGPQSSFQASYLKCQRIALVSFHLVQINNKNLSWLPIYTSNNWPVFSSNVFLLASDWSCRQLSGWSIVTAQHLKRPHWDTGLNLKAAYLLIQECLRSTDLLTRGATQTWCRTRWIQEKKNCRKTENDSC